MSLWQRLCIAFSRLFPIRQKTMFGTAQVYEIVWQDDKPLRVLDVEGTYQSATYLDDRWCEVPFPYLALYDKLFEQVPDARDILMLGGGAFAFPKHAGESWSQVAQLSMKGRNSHTPAMHLP